MFDSSTTMGGTPSVGNLVVVQVSAPSLNSTFTPPAGWSTALYRPSAGGGGAVGIYYRVWTGGEAATYTWNISGGTTNIFLAAFEFQTSLGAGASWILDQTLGDENQTSTNPHLVTLPAPSSGPDIAAIWGSAVTNTTVISASGGGGTWAGYAGGGASAIGGSGTQFSIASAPTTTSAFTLTVTYNSLEQLETGVLATFVATVPATDVGPVTTIGATAALTAPTRTATGSASPATIQALAAAPTPSIGTQTNTPTIGTITATAALPDPTFQVGTPVDVSTIAAVAALPAPTIDTQTNVSVAAIAGVAALPAPTLQVSAEPPVIAGVAALPDPTITASLTVPVIAGAAALPAPAVTSQVSLTTIAGVAAVPAVTVAASGQVTTAVIAAVGALPAVAVRIVNKHEQFPPGDAPYAPEASGPYDRFPLPPYDQTRAPVPGASVTQYRPGQV